MSTWPSTATIVSNSPTEAAISVRRAMPGDPPADISSTRTLATRLGEQRYFRCRIGLWLSAFKGRGKRPRLPANGRGRPTLPPLVITRAQGCGLLPLVSDAHRRAATFLADRSCGAWEGRSTPARHATLKAARHHLTAGCT